LPDVDTMIAGLAARLEGSPADSEGWRMLGWSYFETQRYPEAVEAYARAVALKSSDGSYQSAYGEALASAAGGVVTPDALKAFQAAAKAMPKDERTRYFLGLAKNQTGDAKGALEDWIAALRDSTPESIWASRLRTQIGMVSKAAGIDVSGRLPPPPVVPEERFAGLTATEIQQVESLRPEDQKAMIDSMVEGLSRRLAQDPRDPEGWVRLIRSRKVLAQPDFAQDALARALAVFADDPQTQARIRSAAAGLGIVPRSN
jgi:cytochrome c-type biogenesis protein CcmH